jgi:hypothetical protein
MTIRAVRRLSLGLAVLYAALGTLEVAGRRHPQTVGRDGPLSNRPRVRPELGDVALRTRRA